MDTEKLSKSWPAFEKFAQGAGISLDERDDWLPWWDCFIAGSRYQYAEMQTPDLPFKLPESFWVVTPAEPITLSFSVSEPPFRRGRRKWKVPTASVLTADPTEPFRLST